MWRPALNLFVLDLSASPPGLSSRYLAGDLSRPLVTTMGHHDPLDGFITCIQLEATASRLSDAPAGPTLGLPLADHAGSDSVLT